MSDLTDFEKERYEIMRTITDPFYKILVKRNEAMEPLTEEVHMDGFRHKFKRCPICRELQNYTNFCPECGQRIKKEIG